MGTANKNRLLITAYDNILKLRLKMGQKLVSETRARTLMIGDAELDGGVLKGGARPPLCTSKIFAKMTKNRHILRQKEHIFIIFYYFSYLHYFSYFSYCHYFSEFHYFSVIFIVLHNFIIFQYFSEFHYFVKYHLS